MSNTESGYKLMLAVVVAFLIIAGRSCGNREGRYNPPDAMDYENIDAYKKDRIEYDKNYEQDRRDYQAEHAQDNNW